jgi:hypothetical protein
MAYGQCRQGAASFMHGFMKGMSAPINLQQSHRPPQIKITYVSSQRKTPGEALLGDWEKIGIDIKRVIESQRRNL